MVSDKKEPMLYILEKSLVFKLKLIRQILDFFQADFDGKEEEMVELLKQVTDYNFSVQTIRKLQRK